MTNSFTKQYQDGAALTEAMLNSAYTTLKPSISNMALSTSGSSSFQVMRSTGNNVAPVYDDIGDILASGTNTTAGANALLAKASGTVTLDQSFADEVIDTSKAFTNFVGNLTSSQNLTNSFVTYASTTVSSTGGYLITANTEFSDIDVDENEQAQFRLRNITQSSTLSQTYIVGVLSQQTSATSLQLRFPVSLTEIASSVTANDVIGLQARYVNDSGVIIQLARLRAMRIIA